MAEAELNLNIDPALRDIDQLGAAFDDLLKGFSNDLADSIQKSVEEGIKGLSDSFDSLADDIGKSLASVLGDTFDTSATGFSDSLQSVSDTFSEQLTSAFANVPLDDFSTSVQDAVAVGLGDQLQLPLDDAGLTDEIDAAVSAATDTPLAFTTDDAALTDGISTAADDAAASANLQFEVDPGFIAGSIDDAVGSADHTISLEVNGDEITAAIDDAIASADTSSLDFGGIQAGASGASQGLGQLNESLGQASTGAHTAQAELGTLEGITEAVGIASEGAGGGFSGFVGKVLPGIAIFSGAALGIKEITQKGTESVEATRRMGSAFGDLAPAIEKVPIGSLNFGLDQLSTKIGFSLPSMRQQVATFGDVAKGAGASAAETLTASHNMESLAVQVSTLNPRLGTADTVFQGLTRAVARGGPALSRYGISLSAVDISARAATLRSQRLGISIEDARKTIEPFDKQAAGASLAMEQLAANAERSGTTLDKQFTDGAQSATIQFQALREAIGAQVEEIGTAFVGPVLAITQSLEPIGLALIDFFGGLFAAILPAIQGAIQGVTTALGPLITLIPTLVEPLKGAFESLGPVLQGLGLVFQPVVQGIANFVGEAAKIGGLFITDFFRGFSDAVKTALPYIHDAALFIADLVPGLDGISKAIEGQTGAGGVLSDTAQGLGKVAAAGVGIAGVGAAVVGASSAISGIGQGITTVIDLIGGAGGVFTTFIGIALAVGAAFAVLYQTVPAVHDALDGLASTAQDVLSGAFETLKTVVEEVGAALSTAWNAFTTAFTPVAETIANVLLPSIGDAFSALFSIASPIIDGIKLLWHQLTDTITDPLSGAKSSGIFSFFNDLATTVFNKILDINDWIVGLTAKLREIAAGIDPKAVADTLRNMFAPLVEIGQTVADVVIPAIAGAWEKFTSSTLGAYAALLLVGAAFGPVGIIVGALAGSFDQLAGVVDGIVSAFQDNLAGALTIVGGALAAFFVLGGGLTAVLDGIAGVVAGVAGGILDAGVAAEAVISPFAAIAESVGGIVSAFGEMGAAIALAGPILLPVIAIAAAVAAAIALIVINFDSIAAFLQPLGEAIGNAISNLAGPIESLMTGLGAALGQVGQIFSDIGERLAAIGSQIASSPVGIVIGVIVTAFRTLLEIGITDFLAAVGVGFEVFGAIIGPIVQVVRGIIDVLIDMAAALIAIITLDPSGFADALNSIFGDIGTILDGLGHAVIDGITALVSAIPEALDSIGSGIMSAVRSFFVDIFGDVGGDIFDGFVNGLGALAGLVDIVLKPFDDMVNAILGFFGIASPSKLFLDIATSLIDGFVQGLLGLGSAILGAIGDAFTGLGQLWLDAITLEWDIVVAFFTTVPQLILDAIVGAAGILLDIGSTLIGLISDGIEASVNLIGDIFTAIPGLILSAITGAASVLSTVGQFLINLVVQGVTLYAHLLWDFWVVLPQKILGFIIGAAGVLIQGGASLLNSIVNGIQSVAGTLWSFFSSLPGKILSLLGNVASWLLNVGRDALTGLLNGITAGAGAVWDFFTGLPDKIVGFIGNIGSKLISIGKNAIQGFIDGMTSIDLGSIVSDVFGGFVDSVTSFLGISSPSKKFMLVGQDSVEGYRKGVAATSPQLNSDGTKMAKDFVVATTAGLSNSHDKVTKEIENLLGKGMTNKAISLLRDSGDEIKGGISAAFGGSFDDAIKQIEASVPKLTDVIKAATDAATPKDDAGQVTGAIDPAKFNDSLLQQANDFSAWTDNLSKIAQDGNAALAQHLAEVGPEAGKGLADALAAQDPNVAAGAELMLQSIQRKARESAAQLANLAPAFGDEGFVAGDVFAQKFGLGINPIPEVTKGELIKAQIEVSNHPGLVAAGGVVGGKVTAAYATELKLHGASDDEIKKALVIFEADKPSNGGAGKLGKNQNEAFTKALVLAGATKDQIHDATKAFEDDTSAASAGKVHGVKVGQAIKEGVKEPIRNSKDLNDAVGDMAVIALQAAKNRIESKSPSKLFARELGVPIVQGVALGISDNGDLVDTALADIFSRVSSAQIDFSNVAAGLSALPTEITQNIGPDGRPINIQQVNVETHITPDTTPAQAQELGTIAGQAASREIITAVRGL